MADTVQVRLADRSRGRWRGKEKYNAKFLTFKLDRTAENDEGVWRPIKN